MATLGVMFTILSTVYVTGTLMTVVIGCFCYADAANDFKQAKKMTYKDLRTQYHGEGLENLRRAHRYVTQAPAWPLFVYRTFVSLKAEIDEAKEVNR